MKVIDNIIMIHRSFLLVVVGLFVSRCQGLVPSSSSRRSFINTATTTTFGGIIASTIVGNTNILPSNAIEYITPETNEKAPIFELPNSRGTGETSLDILINTGKWTVLYFYPGAFTQGCTMEARNFQRDIDNYRKLNAQIVGVSVDPPEKNAQFCSSEGLDFYMLSDTGGRVSKLYGSALSIPGFGTFSNRQTYIIDPNGNLRWVFTDVESRIPRHSTEVLEKLQELEATA